MAANEVDYLVVGAGAAGMAFTDALLAHGNADVMILDRRSAPGGHWIDAYPFVRLHQPSTFYGVDSTPLGTDAVDQAGLNAGFHELAGVDALRAYYAQLMQQRLLASGRVRYFPCSDYVGTEQDLHCFRSRLTGDVQQVKVRRKLVDTGYLEGRIPATGALPFQVDQDVQCLTPAEIARVDRPPAQIVIIGAGKTALDTLVWLLGQGVPAQRLLWVKPREGWWLNRRHFQPHDGLPDLVDGIAVQLQAFAEAATVDDVFTRLEAEQLMLRVDDSVTPTMIHGAIIGEAELALLRQVQNVVRLGRVKRLQRGQMVLDQGTVATDSEAVYVHCAAQGLARPPLRPIFEENRVTVQPMFWGFACFQFALIGVIEALVDSQEEKNRLCRPIAYWDRNVDYLTSYLALMNAERARSACPAVADWARNSRLNPLAGVGAYADSPKLGQARERIKRSGAAAAANLQKLIAAERMAGKSISEQRP